MTIRTEANTNKRNFLFLQGPVGGFFPKLAELLEADGHNTFRINLCLGDKLFWRRAGATNYRGTFSNWAEFIEDFLKREKITDILLLGEQRDYHLIAIETAKKMGISVTVTDFGYIRPDWITLEPFAMNGGSPMTRDPKEILAIAKDVGEDIGVPSGRFTAHFWSMALPDIIYNLACQFGWFLFPHYQSHQKYNVAATYIGTLGRVLTLSRRNAKANEAIQHLVSESKEHPIFLLPLQMETDFQLRAYSDFSSMQEVMDKVMGSFAQNSDNSARLVVKLHPFDPSVQNFSKHCARISKKHGISDRVWFIDGGNGEHLMESCAGTVTVNSTMGLGALMLDCPTFVLANCNYRVEGLVAFENLDAFWTAQNPVDGELRDAFVQTLISTALVRGLFYDEPGLNNGVAETKWRLINNKVGVAVPRSAISI